MKRSRTMAIDILTGLAAMLLFILTDGFLHVGADSRIGVIVIAALYFCAGLSRGNTTPVNAWVKGLLVSSVGCAAFCTIGWNGVQHIELLILISAAISFAICGVYARRVPRSAALTLALIAFSFVALFAETGVPSLTTRFAVRSMMTPAPQFSIEGWRANELFPQTCTGASWSLISGLHGVRPAAGSSPKSTSCTGAINHLLTSLFGRSTSTTVARPWPKPPISCGNTVTFCPWRSMAEMYPIVS